MKRWPWVLSFLMFFILQSRILAQETGGPIVREIEIRFDGPETVNRAVVMANIQTALGKPRQRDVVEKDVRSLIGTGFFFDVRVLEEPVSDGVKVVFQVRGKATIKEVTFEGNKVFKDDRLKRESSQKAGDILDERKAHADALKIEELYQKGGWPDVKVEPIVTIDKDTGKAILKIKTTEGDRVFIGHVRYSGLKAYKAGELNKLVKTRRR